MKSANGPRIKNKSAKKETQEKDQKEYIPVIPGSISAGRANELSLLSRLEPPMRKRVRARLGK